jgi:hypothetical protein
VGMLGVEISGGAMGLLLACTALVPSPA